MCDIVERLLAKRGLAGSEREAFLDPSLKRLSKTGEVPGIQAAADVIMPFVRSGRKIIVFGDYDCDGVCASAILVKTLRKIGATVEPFVPDRFTEGYGMTPPSVSRMLKTHPDVSLVITVDCGITSTSEVAELKRLGIAVVVTDHHLPPEVLPECDALMDPKIASQRDVAEQIGAKELCGAGVAFFLAGALAARATEEGLYHGEKFGAPLLVLAGLATVVDSFPLLGQNRIIAANALRAFHGTAPVGLHELLLRAQRRPVDLTSRDFGFLLGPRINAAGRMASATKALDLLLTEDREEARNLAQMVDVHNSERKTVEDTMARQALAQIEDGKPEAVVVSNGELPWHPGVCGIVASRILERFGVPVAVIVDGRGSVRAPDGYDMHAALAACNDALERFGGHAVAGGFSVKEGRFEDFKAMFTAACIAQRNTICSNGADTLGALREPDMWVDPDDLTMTLHDELKTLEPFGEGNPEPVFGLREITFADIRIMGESGKHAAFSFSDRRIPRATWWGHGDDAGVLRTRSADRFDVTFTLDSSEWGGGEPHLELRICSIA